MHAAGLCEGRFSGFAPPLGSPPTPRPGEGGGAEPAGVTEECQWRDGFYCSMRGREQSS